MSQKQIAIAIDGPAAAGKSTVAKMVANRLSYIYIDTGAMYRALTLQARRENIPLTDDQGLSDVLLHTRIELQQDDREQRVLLNGEDVTEEIRTLDITNNVSYVAEHATVRKHMVQRQQKMAARRGVVMDGRDIGTHVIPDAEIKIFLVASVEERAQRRHKENAEKGYPTDIAALKKEIEQRDAIDSRRDAAPLLKADDAYEIDTTNCTITEVTEMILEKADELKRCDPST